MNAAPGFRLRAPKRPMRHLPSPWVRKLRMGAVLALAGAVLALVFGLYARADFMLQMANQLWSCF